MTRRHAPRLALALLERFVPDSAPLAGDLVEEFERRQSSGLVLVAGAGGDRHLHGPTRSAEVRPLRLVDLQPVDALERSRTDESSVSTR